MKYILALVLGLTVAALSVSPALAGGDKVRGENGVGSVVQNCVNFSSETWECLD